MKDYTLYIAATYGFTAFVWMAMILHSLYAWKKTKKREKGAP